MGLSTIDCEFTDSTYTRMTYGNIDGSLCRYSIKFSDGSKYLGTNWDTHKVNKITGHGIFTYPSGDSYEGTLLNNKRHKSGIYTFNNNLTNNINNIKSIQSDDWNDDQYGDFCVVCYHPVNNSELKYEGQFVNFLKHGEGILYHKYILNNTQYENVFNGYFINDLLENYAYIRFYYISVNIKILTGEYIGEIKNNFLCGNGTYKTPNGSIIIGQFDVLEDIFHLHRLF